MNTVSDVWFEYSDIDLLIEICECAIGQFWVNVYVRYHIDQYWANVYVRYHIDQYWVNVHVRYHIDQYRINVYVRFHIDQYRINVYVRYLMMIFYSQNNQNRYSVRFEIQHFLSIVIEILDYRNIVLIRNISNTNSTGHKAA